MRVAESQVVTGQTITQLVAVIEGEGQYPPVVRMELPVGAWRLISALCELQHDVSAVVGYSEPNDCFCGDGGAYWDVERSDLLMNVVDVVRRGDSFQSSGSAVAYIERAVRAQVARDVRRPVWPLSNARVVLEGAREWAEWGVMLGRTWLADRLMGVER
jgi:hypothetical protein